MSALSIAQRGTPLSELPLIDDTDTIPCWNDVVMVVGSPIAALRSISAERDLGLLWPCAAISFVAPGEGAFVFIIHRCDGQSVEMILAGYGLQMSRRMLRLAAAQLSRLGERGITQIRVRIPSGTAWGRRRARRWRLHPIDAGGDGTLYALEIDQVAFLARTARAGTRGYH